MTCPSFRLTVRFACVILGLSYSLASAGDITVDPDLGDDAADGVTAPVRTIRRALRLAKPGDTVHLQPKVYRDYAGFYNLSGEPGRPITLDGHGATLEGSDPLDPQGWVEVEPGLFRHDELIPQFNAAMLGRWFFLFDGKMQLMGRTSKGASEPLKTPESLEPGEWTFVAKPADDPNRLLPGSFFIKLAAGQSLASANIAVPVRSAGVQTGGDNRHLIIRNLTATHPYNDGFNIHGHCEDVLFENIAAIECGDDGISAHETATYTVNGFVSIGNSTGICDTGASRTTYENVFIRDCHGHDLYFLDTGIYSLRHVLVDSSAWRALAVIGREDPQPCRLSMEDVCIIRRGDPTDAIITSNCVVEAKRTTLWDMGLQLSGGKVHWLESVIGGTRDCKVTICTGANWLPENNRYALSGWDIAGKALDKAGWQSWRQETGLDAGSELIPLTSPREAPAGLGADLASLIEAVPAAYRPAFEPLGNPVPNSTKP